MSVRSVSDVRALFAKASISEIPRLVTEFSSDDRAGVKAVIQSAERRLQVAMKEESRLLAMMSLQRELEAAGSLVVAGVDEVGRGALAGPVTAAAVVLSTATLIPRLNDSKRLTPATREMLAESIHERAAAVAIAHVWPDRIDAVGIAEANTLAMRNAILELALTADHIIADGLRVELGVPATFVVGGDASCGCVAAASIVAKVARDALMRDLETEYPGYGFAVNKGYGTAEHISAIRDLGPSAVHRLSFAPCSQDSLF